MKGSGTLDYRPDVDGLRAVAVALVVLFHAGVPGFSGGFIGVDVFFVISGYLITRLIVKERGEGVFSFARFYMRRIRRLLPALFTTILLTLITGWFLFPPSGFEQLGESALAAVFSVSNFYFWDQAGYFDIDADLKPLLHTWSLGVEEQFYLLWPMMLILLLRWRWHAVPVFLAIGITISLIATERTLDYDPEAAFFLLPFRVMELGAGALVAFAPRDFSTVSRNQQFMGWTGLATILFSAVSYSDATPFPGLAAILPTCGTLLIIYAGALSSVGKILSWLPVVYVGLISYSLYLVHWPLFVFYRFATGSELAWPEQAGLILVSVGLAAGIYHLVEQPFRARSMLLPSINLGVKRAGACIAIAGVICIAMSGVIMAGKGLPGRYSASPEIAGLLESMDEVLPGEVINTLQALPPEAPSVLVVGDSHTAPLWMAVAQWGAENGVRVDQHFLGGGCPSLYRVYVHGDPQQSADCAATKDETLEELAGRGYDVVILSSRWGLYTGTLSTDDPFEAERVRSLSIKQQVGFDPSLGPSRTAFTESLRQTVRLFAGQGAEVIFVGQAPPISGRPERCIALQASLEGVQRYCNKASREEVSDEISWATDRAAALDEPGLYVVDGTDRFCEESDCRIMQGGKMLYMDDSHLSRTGGEVMFKAVAPVLERLVLADESS